MSSLEPGTTAKVILVTTKGPIEIEIWAKEVPIISRQFIQNCIDKRYVGTTFNKVIKDYLVQTSKISGQEAPPIKDEFHSRLRFNKRGLLGAVNNDKRNTNNVDSIFITLKPTPEFNNNYVLFGKIMGESIYNVVKINESELKSDEEPMYPAEILDIKVPMKYFDDIVETKKKVSEPPKKKAKKPRKLHVKLDYDLEDEPDTGFRMKSAHELLQDKRLSNKLYVDKMATSPEMREDDTSKFHSDMNKDKIEKPNQVPINVKDTCFESTIKNEKRIDVHNLQEKKSNIKAKRTRNPNIDSDYDSDLDLSSSESIDMQIFVRRNPHN